MLFCRGIAPGIWLLGGDGRELAPALALGPLCISSAVLLQKKTAAGADGARSSGQGTAVVTSRVIVRVVILILFCLLAR